MKKPTAQTCGCFPLHRPPYSERKAGWRTHCPESMETGICTIKSRVCRAVPSAQAAAGGSHTASAGTECCRYRTASQRTANGHTEKETRDRIMILEVRRFCIIRREQIDRANQTNMEDFLRSQGETLIRSGKGYRWKCHDSLTVRGNKWFRHSQSRGGYPVDFVMEFYGKSFPEAVQLLTGEAGAGKPDACPAPSPDFRLPLHNTTNTKAIKYLTEERKIDRGIVDTFVAPGIFTRTPTIMWCL